MTRGIAAETRKLSGKLWFKDEAGAAAVEFALVFPLVLVMLFAIFEFGRAWNIHQVITDSAREGARRAVVADGANKQVAVPAVIQDRLTRAGLSWDGVVQYSVDCATLPNPPVPAGEEVAVAGCGWGRDTGEEARVVIRARYPFHFLRPLLALLPGDGEVGPRVLSTNFVMRNE